MPKLCVLTENLRSIKSSGWLNTSELRRIHINFGLNDVNWRQIFRHWGRWGHRGTPYPRARPSSPPWVSGGVGRRHWGHRWGHRATPYSIDALQLLELFECRKDTEAQRWGIHDLMPDRDYLNLRLSVESERKNFDLKEINLICNQWLGQEMFIGEQIIFTRNVY